MKIAALTGDYWHDAGDAKAGLKAALAMLPYKEEIDLYYITHEEVTRTLDAKPDLFINAKMNQLNPQDEQVVTWLTGELDQQLNNYVEAGGNVLAWHAGLAGYSNESGYIDMLRGWFDFHPPGLQEVTYIVPQNDEGKETSFKLKDEQYFVTCNQAQTKIYLRSTGADGDSIAGWNHTYGKGKICCFTPAHTKEAMLHKNITGLLADRIDWLLS